MHNTGDFKALNLKNAAILRLILPAQATGAVTSHFRVYRTIMNAGGREKLQEP